MAEMCVRTLVTGHVQGVGFRFHTAHQAIKLGLTGYAINLPFGDVEVVACGEPSRVAALLAWLEQGPKTARVDGLDSQEIEKRYFAKFSMG
ncbi:Acylphosphatase [Vibrio stylophorae]|uniref:acylphosphatase n=1 Tax=Vibrio stylophorae TaxID=659351 RepID=A0ABN8DUS9_9VIBR|nr:acylphosphatase [Vibrio stylophorae]CAH0533756.1 Acylphosphatase [Vibrio stylophorae]